LLLPGPTVIIFSFASLIFVPGIIQITDRNGGIVDEIPMTSSSPILSLSWDKDGDYLAVLQDGNSIVPLWSLSNRRVIPLETNLVDPTFLSWSKTGPQLAIGTAKGNLLIYNKQQKKKIPVVGKHAKRILCGGWSNGGNRLVLGSDDRTITVSNETGDTLIHTELKYSPYEASFTNRQGYQSRSLNRDYLDDTVSANLGGKSLLLLNILDEKEDPMELTFASNSVNGPCRYGDLLHYEWYNDNMLIIGFSGGWVIVVSTEINEIGEEKYAIQIHSQKLTTFSYNPHLKKVATAGNDGVRILDTKDFKELKNEYIPLEDLENGKISQLDWSPDGQILSISTSSGNIYNFLAKMSILYTTYRSTICYLSSLREVSIMNIKRKTRPMEVTLMLEPSVIAVGSKHVAGGMNNKVYYHRIIPNNSGSGPPSSDLVNEQEYVSTVRAIQLNNAFAAVLTDSKVILHPIEPISAAQQQQQTKTFPTREEGAFAKVTCVALTDDFMYYGTEAGAVEVFYLGDWMILPGAELRIDAPIKALYPNQTGTRVIVVDISNQIFLYNPVTGGGVNQSILKFDSVPSSFTNILWDVAERNVILIFEGKFVHTYVYIPSSVKGPLLTKLGPIEISADGSIALHPDRAEITQGNIVLMSSMGALTGLSLGGTVNFSTHPFFDQLNELSKPDGTSKTVNHLDRNHTKAVVPAVQKLRFCQSLALNKLEDAWHFALDLDRREFWLALSGKAMEMMNIELAIRVYRQLGDAGMVMSLQPCLQMEDRNLLSGYISLLFSDYARAQELFLMSSKPVYALNMQCDLMKWDQALKLAHKLAPERVPFISIKFGQQLEFREDYERAFRLYESALNAVDNEGLGICPDNLVSVAMSGIARCHLRQGNIRQGVRIAAEVNTTMLYTECGEILEILKQYSEAAAMFIKANNLEKAADIHVKYLLAQDKNRLNEAINIFEKITNSQLNSSFAKLCVGYGRYDEAARAYERAKDFDKVPPCTPPIS
jgi:WD repeat-containing protein 19